MKFDKTRTGQQKGRSHSAKILILSVIFLLLASPLASARSFIVYNTSAPAQAYFIVNGTTGNSGIGLMNPAYPLDVSGAGRFSGNLYLGTAGRYVYDTGSIIGVSSGLLLGGNLDLGGYSIVSGAWLNATNLNVSSNGYFGGNVGIGTANPARKLSFGSSVNNNPLFIQADAGGIGMDQNTAGVRIVGDYASPTNSLADIGYYTSGVLDHANWVSRLKVMNSGNVGIGTTGPVTKLEVVGTGENTNAERLAIEGKHVTAGNAFAALQFRDGYASGGSKMSASIMGIYESTTTYDDIGLQFNSVNAGSGVWAMRISKSGNVGIGDTSPDYKLDVWGTICQDTNSDDTCDGTVTSDIRLKTNMTQITDAVAKIEKLKGVEFQWKNMPATEHLGKGTQIGLVAQDVEKVFPSLVYEDMDGYKMIDYQKLTAVLIEAAKEQQAEMQNLAAKSAGQEREIEAMNARIAALEEKVK